VRSVSVVFSCQMVSTAASRLSPPDFFVACSCSRDAQTFSTQDTCRSSPDHPADILLQVPFCGLFVSCCKNLGGAGGSRQRNLKMLLIKNIHLLKDDSCDLNLYFVHDKRVEMTEIQIQMHRSIVICTTIVYFVSR
jgi:hypothetical protein